MWQGLTVLLGALRRVLRGFQGLPHPRDLGLPRSCLVSVETEGQLVFRHLRSMLRLLDQAADPAFIRSFIHSLAHGRGLSEAVGC